MATDWFRKRSWSQEDQRDFWQRLARAREYNHAQYVFIQGYTLAKAGPQHRTDAVALFDYVIDHFSHTMHFVQALSAKADCLLDLGDTEGALAYYSRAIQQMRSKPNVQTWAWLDFAWVVATKRLSDHYEGAVDVLNEFGSERQLFLVVVFRLFGSRALIESARGRTDLAADAARAALEAADKEVSGLRYHPKIGIVGSSYDDIRTRLTAIARA